MKTTSCPNQSSLPLRPNKLMPKLFTLIILLCLVAVITSGCQKKEAIKVKNSTKAANLNVSTAASNTEAEKLINILEEPVPEIFWQQVESGRYLPVPYYYQKNVPNYGSYACGPASLKMVLEYKKQTGIIDKEIFSMADIINEIGVANNVWDNSDVDEHFIKNFGITDVALKKLAVQLGYENTIIFGKTFYPNYPASLAIDPLHKGQLINSTDWRAQIDEQGWDTEKLYEIIQQGTPVIVDVTVDLDPLYGPNNSRSYNPFYTADGNKHWELVFSKGHFMVVVGFKNWGQDNPSIVLLDPLQKTNEENNISVYLLDKFEKSWSLLNNQGLIIR